MSPWVFSERNSKEGFVFGFSFQKIQVTFTKPYFSFRRWAADHRKASVTLSTVPFHVPFCLGSSPVKAVPGWTDPPKVKGNIL